MNKELTFTELDTLEFRRDRLRSKARKLEGLLSSHGGSLLPLVRGADGRWSEAKARALIRQLLEGLELIYRDEQEEGEDDPLTDEARAAYESFLYCALRALEAPMPTGDWVGPAGASWDDLIALAEETQFRDKYALWFGEKYGGLEVSCFFYLMDRMYAALTGHPAADHIPAQELSEMEARFRDEIAACEADDLIHRQWAEALEQGEEEDLFADPEEEVFPEEEEDEEAAVAAWAKRFGGKDAFPAAYLAFRQHFFDSDAWRFFAHRVERLVDLFLYARGNAGLLGDQSFLRACQLLDRAENELRALQRGGERHGH